MVHDMANNIRRHEGPQTLNELSNAIRAAFVQLDQDEINRAIDHTRVRAQLCYRKHGGIFENML